MCIEVDDAEVEDLLVSQTNKMSIDRQDYYAENERELCAQKKIVLHLPSNISTMISLAHIYLG